MRQNGASPSWRRSPYWMQIPPFCNSCVTTFCYNREKLTDSFSETLRNSSWLGHIMSETTIASFILRFTQEQTSGPKSDAGPWRGVIRHVQSSDESHFTRVEDALTFVARYVDIAYQEETPTEDEQ